MAREDTDKENTKMTYRAFAAAMLAAMALFALTACGIVPFVTVESATGDYHG